MDDTEIFYALQASRDTEQLEHDAEYAKQAAMAFLLAGIEHARQERIHIRYAKRLYLTRFDLLRNPRFRTPWQRLYKSQNDRAFITTMGFDTSTFHAILDTGFTHCWNTTPIGRADVNPKGTTRLFARSLDAAGALGLVLHYLNTTIHEVGLQEIFALVPATCSRYITSGLRMLLDTFRSMPDARISWPRGDEFSALNDLIRPRHPLLTGAFASIDGLLLPLQTSGRDDIENATYNGWLREHFVSSVLVFSPCGRLAPVHPISRMIYVQ